MERQGLILLSGEDKPKALKNIKYILVDEYQDTHPRQLEILKQLYSVTKNIMVFGDPMQVLYGFRGVKFADLGRVLGTDVRSYPLSKSFRLTAQNASVANAIAGKSGLRHAETIVAEREGEKPTLVKATDFAGGRNWFGDRVELLHQSGVQLKDIAVLAASRSTLLEYEKALRQRNLPFFASARRVEATEVEAFKSLLYFIGEWKRFGDKELLTREIHQNFKRLRGTSKVKLKPGTLGAVSRDLRTAAQSQSVQSYVEGAGTAIKRLLRAAGKRPKNFDLLLKDHLAAAGRYQDLEEFFSDSIWNTDVDAVVTSTIHGAKGKEWRHVFLVGMIDGAMPSRFASKADYGEQRRMFFVGATRARDRLYLIQAPMLAPNMFKPDKLDMPSPFVTEIETPEIFKIVRIGEIS
jgi:DNA helicase-2/ATP-dependent DNA helicase PcrA